MIRIIAKDTHGRVFWDKVRKVPVQFVVKTEGTWVMVNKVTLLGVYEATLHHAIGDMAIFTIVVNPDQEASVVRSLNLITQQRR